MNINILILFFQIYGWEPEPYNITLPDEAPQSLKQAVASAEDAKKKGGMVWFSCEGENPADIENIGEVDWYPEPGVPKYFFPYQNQDGYLSPAVFAHFKSPKSKYYALLLQHTYRC